MNRMIVFFSSEWKISKFVMWPWPSQDIFFSFCLYLFTEIINHPFDMVLLENFFPFICSSVYCFMMMYCRLCLLSSCFFLLLFREEFFFILFFFVSRISSLFFFLTLLFLIHSFTVLKRKESQVWEREKEKKHKCLNKVDLWIYRKKDLNLKR